MIDESRCIAMHGGINHSIIIYAEHIAANTFRFIILLTHVTQTGANYLKQLHSYTNLTITASSTLSENVKK